MRGWLAALIVLVVLAGAVAALSIAAPWSSRSTESGDAEEAGPGPVATVGVVPLRRETIDETLSAYGSVVAALGETETFSVPYECRIRSVQVAPGQEVDAQTPMIALEPSPDTALQLEQARGEREAAAGQLQLVEQRLGMKLATQQELLEAQQQLRSAERTLSSLEERGVDGPTVISANAPGLVSRIDVQPGAIAAAGAPLVETVGRHQIVVRLGVEPEDVEHLSVGQAVELRRTGAAWDRTRSGHIRLITRQVNPETRLVDVFVTPPEDEELLLNDYVEGRIVTATTEGLTVPPAAVLPREGSHVLFTVEGGRAVRHEVEIGLENDERIEVSGVGLHEGQDVVVVGQSELEDGMAVKVEPSG